MVDLNIAFQHNYLTSSYNDNFDKCLDTWSHFSVDEIRQENTNGDVKILTYGRGKQIDVSEYEFTNSPDNLRQTTYTKSGKLFNGVKYDVGNLVLTYSGNDIVQFEKYIRDLKENQVDINMYSSDFIEDSHFVHRISIDNSSNLMYLIFSGGIEIAYNGQISNEFEEFMKQITNDYDNIQFTNLKCKKT